VQSELRPLQLQLPPPSGIEFQPSATGNEIFSPNRITPGNLEALNKRGIFPNVQRQSEQLNPMSNLNPPIANDPDYSSAAGQREAPKRMYPGERITPLEDILKPIEGMQHPGFTSPVSPNVRIDGTPFQMAQEPFTAFEDSTRANTQGRAQEARLNEERRQTSTYTPEEQAELQSILEDDENYQSLLKELSGTNIESDFEIQTLAKTIKDKWGLTYNMTDIYRTMARQNPEFAKRVKADYLDPFDQSKGDYARGFTGSVQKVADITKKYGIKKGSKMDKALIWFREGQRVTKYENAVDDTGKKYQAPVTEKYTLEDLKREHPKDWQKVVEADKELKVINDEYFNRISETLKQIYPNVEERTAPWESALKDLEEQKYTLSEEAYKSGKAELLAKIQKERKGKRLDYRQNYYHHYKDVIEGLAGLQNIFDTPATLTLSYPE
jgi:hypothetical protein